MSQSREWIDRTNINSVLTIIAIVVALPSFVGYLKGILTLDMLIGVVIVIMFILLVISMFSYNKILNKNKKDENKLGKVDNKMKEALASVYDQKRIEIEKLENDLAFWKDRASNQKDEIDKLNNIIYELEGTCNGVSANYENEREQNNKLRNAYIRLRTAYRKNLNMASREVQCGLKANVVGRDSKERFQNMSEHDLFIEAERLSRESGVPDDA
jgi:ABC-type multidrug transport system fused ATPase/permease subunit